MAAGRAILTSDRDFARWMCGDLARYFDPLSAGAAADAIEALVAAPPDAEWAGRARARLAEFPADWDETEAAFARVLREVSS